MKRQTSVESAAHIGVPRLRQPPRLAQCQMRPQLAELFDDYWTGAMIFPTIWQAPPVT